MENNDLALEKFNKIYELTEQQNPGLFSQLCVHQLQDYAPHVICFNGENLNSGQLNQTYLTNVVLRDSLENLNKIIYLKDPPNIVLLQDSSDTLILESKIASRLSNYLQQQQQQHSIPYFSELQARTIIMQLTRSVEDFRSQQIQYDCISPRNVVMDQEGIAHFSLVGYLLKIDQHNPEYSKANIQQNLSFSMASLLFKLLYGFSPHQSENANFKRFDPDEFIAELKSHSQKKYLKIYYYCERNLFISPLCQQLLKQALAGNMVWSKWLQHSYFQQGFQLAYKNFIETSHVCEQNKLIKMVNGAKLSESSTIMTSINYRNAHPYQKLNSKPLPSVDQPSFQQAVQCLRRHRLFGQISSSVKSSQAKIKSLDRKQQQSTIIEMGYFYEQNFDTHLNNPCLELIRLIEGEKSKCKSEEQRSELDRKMKLYGYPYAVAFQLIKVKAEQPPSIKSKIDDTVDLLFQLSAFNQINTIPPLLNSAVPSFKSFSEVKPRYRANINQLYQHFLTEAMKKYNSKSKNEANKEIGLSYYKLCLKILEASLIVRKGGADLNLERIEYSSRKQIQDDLAELLGKYFPQRPEIH